VSELMNEHLYYVPKMKTLTDNTVM